MRTPAYRPRRHSLPATDRYVVLFDGGCGTCHQWVSRLRRWDREGVLDFLPFQDPGVPNRFHWIPPEAMAESVHVVAPDGSTWHGAGAAEQLAHLLPGGWPLALLFRVPLVRRCADGIYRRVARTRTSSGCEIRPLP